MTQNMKLGIFDSGLGGLLIAKAVREHIPDIDMLYLGDTLHLPYGNRSEDAIYMYTKRGIDFMFNQGCQLIVIACNTASAAALRRLQQTYIQDAWSGRNVIGVVVPTLEETIERDHDKIGLIGTNYIVSSGVFQEELSKMSSDIDIVQKATPLLVPLIESGGEKWSKSVLEHYLEHFKEEDIKCLILGCTHYPFLKNEVKEILGEDTCIISQDEIIPERLSDYLSRHSEYNDLIGRNGRSEFFVSDITQNYIESAHIIYDETIDIKKADLSA